jgi:hypothetical protein
VSSWCFEIASSIAVVAALAGGCGGERCVRNSDCDVALVCSIGECVVPPVPDDGGPSDGAIADGALVDGRVDAADGLADAASDATTADSGLDGGVDAGATDGGLDAWTVVRDGGDGGDGDGGG